MAAIAERQHQARGAVLGLEPRLKKVVDDYVANLEIATGMDIDGDGDQGNIGHGVLEDPGKKVDLTQDESVQLELWATRLKAVEEDHKTTREEEYKAKVHIATAGQKDQARRNAAHAHDATNDFDSYHAAVRETVENRPYVWVSGKTHGKLYVTLQNLADAAKKSAQNARRGYRHEHAKHPDDPEAAADEMQALSDAALKEVDQFYVRSFVVGGHVQSAKAYCPKLFTRIRGHFGLSYEAFVRLADVAVDGVWQCGEFFFSSKAHVCYKRISVEERKSIIGMLQGYEKYIQHAHLSLLPHFYGLFTIDGQDFLLTNNVFHCVDTIEIMYDLKGCWFRETPLEARAGRHYIMPIGTVADRAELHDSAEVPVARYHSRIINDEKLRHLLHSGNEWAQEAGLVLHQEQRVELLETVRRDSTWLAEQGYYNYAFIVGTHRANPFDDQKLRAIEFNHISRFGGLTPVEDTYHVTIIGPFKRWDAKSKAEYALARMKGRQMSSIAPPELYARRLREELFAVFLQFDINVDYTKFRSRKLAQFAELIQYDKDVMAQDPSISEEKRKEMREAHVLGRVSTASKALEDMQPVTSPLRSMLSASLSSPLASPLRRSSETPGSRAQRGGQSPLKTPLRLLTAMKAMTGGASPLGGQSSVRLESGLDTVSIAARLRQRRLSKSAGASLELEGVGLGIVLGSTKQHRVVISRCLPRRPAALSGKLKTGDRLMEIRRNVEGQWVYHDVGALSCKEAAELLRGEDGELIGLTLIRVEDVPVELQHSSQFAGESRMDVAVDVVLRNGYELPEEEVEEEEGALARDEEATAAVMQETAEFMLMRLNAQIEVSKDMIEQDGSVACAYIPAAEDIIPFVDDLDALDDILVKCVDGAFYPYRSDQVPAGPVGFFPFGVAFYDDAAKQVVHNRVYMVKRDPEHTQQIVSLGGWGQHPEDPWLGYHQWITTNGFPWLVTPHWLQDEGELFPSMVQLVAALPMLRKLVDLDDPPWRPPPKVVVREKTPEPELPPDPSLWDVWYHKQRAVATLAGTKLLPRDVETGVPVHERSQTLREEEKTYLPLSGAQVASMVRPAKAMEHLEAYYPDSMPRIKQDLENALKRSVDAAAKSRDALTFPKAGVNEMRSRLFILKANSEGNSASEWRERMFVLRDGVLCFVSEKKRALLKRVCDVKKVSMCTSGKIGPYKTTITMIYFEEEIENSVTLATDREDDFNDWISALSAHSTAVRHVRATL